MIELELTYLAKYLPGDLIKYPFKEIIDIYLPVSFDHPKIRIRKNGDKYEITKKEPIESNRSEMLEQTIKITEAEFNELVNLPGKKVSKRRYLYDYKDHTAEIGIFGGDLNGLVLIDVEFKTVEEKASFKMPDFCLVEVTQEKFTAGGMLCGKKYIDIEEELMRFGYKRLSL